jgi:general secretion pathway protein L
MWKRRILGVDVGVSSIRVAQMVASATGRKTVTRLIMCESQDALAELMQQKAWWKSGDALHVSFPSDRVIVRRLKLPFRDPDKILQTLPFELEGEVPFPVEEIAAGYLLQEKVPDGVELLAIAASKQAVQSWLDGLGPLGVHASVVEPTLAALTRMAPPWSPQTLRTIGMVEIGRSSTNLLLFHEGKVRVLRSFQWGRSNGETEQPLPEALVQEILRTFTTARARGDAPWPEAVYLCGSAIVGTELAPWLEDRWEIPVGYLSPLDLVPWALESTVDAPPALFATAIGLALGSGGRGSETCNLRVGQFAYHPGISILRGRALAALILVLLAAGAGIGSLYAKLDVRRKSLDGLQKETRSIFRKVFPEGAQMAQPAEQMKRHLEERKAKHLNLLAQDPRSTVLELLREISIREQGRALRLTEFDLSGEVVNIRGEANGYDIIEKAKDNWATSPLLDGVEIKSAKKNPKSQLWDFQCSARRKTS